jgi:hypothetical protein
VLNPTEEFFAGPNSRSAFLFLPKRFFTYRWQWWVAMYVPQIPAIIVWSFDQKLNIYQEKTILMTET